MIAIKSNLLMVSHLTSELSDEVSYKLTAHEEQGMRMVEVVEGAGEVLVRSSLPVTKEVRPWVKVTGGMYLLPREIVTDERLKEIGYDVYRTPRMASKDKTILRCDPINAHTESQGKAMDTLEAAGGGFLVLAPGKGKTVAALEVARRWGEPTLIVVEEGALAYQWAEEIKRHLGLQQHEVGMIRQKMNTWNRPFCIALVKSLMNRIDRGDIGDGFFEHFGTVIWDEAHHAQAPTARRTLPLINARRIGLSATPHRDGLERVYMDHIGPVVYEDCVPDIVPTATAIPFNGAFPEFVKGTANAYMGMENAIIESEEYLTQVADHLRNCAANGEIILVVCRRLQAIDFLSDRLPNSAVLSGSVDASERGAVLNSAPIILAQKRIGEEALDRKAISRTVIVVPPGANARKNIEQAAGRATRKLEGKLSVAVDMFYPNTSYGRHLAKSFYRHCKDIGYNLHKNGYIEPAVPTEGMRIKSFSDRPSRLSGILGAGRA